MIKLCPNFRAPLVDALDQFLVALDETIITQAVQAYVAAQIVNPHTTDQDHGSAALCPFIVELFQPVGGITVIHVLHVERRHEYSVFEFQPINS